MRVPHASCIYPAPRGEENPSGKQRETDIMLAGIRDFAVLYAYSNSTDELLFRSNTINSATITLEAETVFATARGYASLHTL